MNDFDQEDLEKALPKADLTIIFILGVIPIILAVILSLIFG